MYIFRGYHRLDFALLLLVCIYSALHDGRTLQRIHEDVFEAFLGAMFLDLQPVSSSNNAGDGDGSGVPRSLVHDCGPADLMMNGGGSALVHCAAFVEGVIEQTIDWDEVQGAQVNTDYKVSGGAGPEFNCKVTPTSKFKVVPSCKVGTSKEHRERNTWKGCYSISYSIMFLSFSCSCR
jgi:hypothetical protein